MIWIGFGLGCLCGLVVGFGIGIDSAPDPLSGPLPQPEPLRVEPAVFHYVTTEQDSGRIVRQ